MWGESGIIADVELSSSITVTDSSGAIATSQAVAKAASESSGTVATAQAVAKAATESSGTIATSQVVAKKGSFDSIASDLEVPSP